MRGIVSGRNGTRFRRSARMVIASALILTIAAFGYLLTRRSQPPSPLEVSLWYWHQPFRIPADELTQLKALGVRRLFVRAGVVRKSGEELRLSLPQVWRSGAPGMDVHLVFPFGPDALRDFGRTPNERIIEALERFLAKERRSAESKGVRITGVQIDLDAPTSKLAKYADLLRRMRVVMPGMALSITALPTWFTSPDLRKVAAQTDFYVPQFYEAVMPIKRDAFAGVSSLARFKRGVAAAGRLGAPFYAGVPSYGHAMVYDDKDRLLGAFHDMGPDDAIREPGFALERSHGLNERGKPAGPGAYIGEDVAEFRAPPIEGVRPYSILYALPAPTMVARHLEALRSNRPANCRGVVLFRYPEAGERATVPFAGLAAVLSSQKAEPAIEMRVAAASAPWEIIESDAAPGHMARELFVTAANTGNANTFFCLDSVSVALVLDRPGIVEVPAPTRGYDAVECYAVDRPASITAVPRTEGLLRSSAARANVLIFRKACLGPGQSLTTGRIRLDADGPTQVRGYWSVRTAGGLETISGSSEVTRLVEPEQGARKDGLKSHVP